jgi:dihydroflavonol-4-reductase
VNLVHVEDIAQSFLLALEKPEARNQTYMIGSEKQYTWREVSDITADILEKKGVTVRLPHALVYAVAGMSEVFSIFQKKPSVLNWEKGRDIVQQHWTMSVDKAKREMGYRQEMSLEEGVRQTTEWYRKHGWI